jgi:hypothetical protein
MYFDSMNIGDLEGKEKSVKTSEYLGDKISSRGKYPQLREVLGSLTCFD